MGDQGRLEKLKQRYEAAAHRVQSCIAAVPDHPNQTPKHLRVGVDMSKSDMGGLASLLIDKGVFTEEEYLEAITAAAEREAEAYETELSVRFGINVRAV